MKLQRFRESKVRVQARFRILKAFIHVNLAYLKRIILRLFRGIRERQFMSYMKIFIMCFQKHAAKFIENFTDMTEGMGDLQHPRLRKLRAISLGLHANMARDDRFGFSILVPVYKPRPDFFRKALESMLDQTSPRFEILVGFDGPQPEAVVEVVAELRRARPQEAERIRVIECDRSQGGGISRKTNRLAAEARHEFLLLMDHDDWIRPDLLFRYEQTLRSAASPETTVLYCDEFKINERDQTIITSSLRKPDAPVFPYIFINWICHALLVHRSLWQKTAGLRPDFDGAQDYDLCLRLDLAGARFVNVPVLLYAWRAHSGSTAGSINQKDYASERGLNALTDYVRAKGLDWDTAPGKFPTSYRGIPRRKDRPKVLAVVPFRNQGDMTVAAVRKALASTDVEVQVCCIDNGSTDKGIAPRLEALGAEVLHSDEPFNFSRLNNIAIERSRYREAPYVLFLNNDVELEPNALHEMTRWIDQPGIGMVGCQLFYPKDYDKEPILQHGGVELDPNGRHFTMQWAHVDKMSFEVFSGFSRVPQVVDAVTAACALVRRSDFLAVGGFDEIYYPIAFSDTDLAVKLRRKGLLCFQTPYARGIHHESISRDYGNIEDFEASRWLYQRLRTSIADDPLHAIRGVPKVE